MTDSWVRYLLAGVELRVCEEPSRWRIRYEDREAEHRYLDHALAGALQRPASRCMGIAMRILSQQPDTEVER